MANRLEIEITASTAGLKAGLQSSVAAAQDAGKQMADAFILDKGKTAILELAGRLSDLGHEAVQAAANVAAIRRELSTVIQDAGQLDKTVGMVREMSVQFGLNANTVADTVQRMSQFGTVTKESLETVINLAAGTHLGLETVGRNFEQISEGGEGASRAILQMARAANISVEALRQAGAEVSDGKLLTDTPEQAEKARKALESLAQTKYPDAAAKMVSSSMKLAGELEELKANIGGAAASLEASAKGGFASLVHAINEDLAPSVKAAIGIFAEFGGIGLSVGASLLGTAAQVGQVVSAIPAAMALFAAAKTVTTVATTAETVATEAETVAHLQNIAAVEGEAVAQVQLAGAKVAVAAASAVSATALALLLAPVAVAAVGIALLTHQLNENAKAQNELTDIEAAGTKALRDHREMIGLTTDELRAHSATAKDVTELILGYREALERARAAGDQAGIDKYIALIAAAIRSRGDLAASEGQVRQTTVDTKAALETAEHAYKMNETSIRDVISAHQDRITALKAEIQQVGQNSVKGQELLKEQRSEEEALHQAQTQMRQDAQKQAEDSASKQAELAADEVARQKTALEAHAAAGTRTKADRLSVVAAEEEEAKRRHAASLLAVNDQIEEAKKSLKPTDALVAEKENIERQWNNRKRELANERTQIEKDEADHGIEIQQHRYDEYLRMMDDYQQSIERARATGTDVRGSIFKFPRRWGGGYDPKSQMDIERV